MPIYHIILLYIIWFAFWGVYNTVLLNSHRSTEKTPKLLTLIYMLVSIIILFSVNALYYSFAAGLTILVFLSVFIKHKLIGRLSNSVFQMVWFYAFSFCDSFG